uniref:Uncharacterized protein n=1 Tax=Aureoumbra lagunensis TaxID=44058 RepID=A0A7S3NR37_9STRA
MEELNKLGVEMPSTNLEIREEKEVIKIRTSLLEFSGAYSKYKMYSRSRMLTMEASYEKSVAVFDELESELNDFQQVLDTFPANIDSTVDALHDANQARLAVMAAHRYHSRCAMHLFSIHNQQDTILAYNLAHDAMNLHIDWLRAKTINHHLPLDALAIVLKNGYADILLHLFTILWTSSTKRKLQDIHSHASASKRLKFEKEHHFLSFHQSQSTSHIILQPLSPRTKLRHHNINSTSSTTKQLKKSFSFIKISRKYTLPKSSLSANYPTNSTSLPHKKKSAKTKNYRSRLVPRFLSRQRSSLFW